MNDTTAKNLKWRKQTAIVIPIKDWEIITNKHQDLKYLTEEIDLTRLKQNFPNYWMAALVKNSGYLAQ